MMTPFGWGLGISQISRQQSIYTLTFHRCCVFGKYRDTHPIHGCPFRRNVKGRGGRFRLLLNMQRPSKRYVFRALEKRVGHTSTLTHMIDEVLCDSWFPMSLLKFQRPVQKACTSRPSSNFISKQKSQTGFSKLRAS